MITHYDRHFSRFQGAEQAMGLTLKALLDKIPFNEVPGRLLAAARVMPENGALMYAAGIKELTRVLMRGNEEPTSYSQLVANRRYWDLAMQVGEFAGPEIASSGLMSDYYVLAYELAGNHAYEVSPDLAEKLLHTELRGVLAEDLHLPYPSVYLNAPTITGFKVYNEISGWHRLEGVYVVEDRQYKELAGEVVPGATRAWRLMLCGEPHGMLTGGPTSIAVPNDAICYFTVPLAEGKTLDECLDLALASFKKALEHKELTGVQLQEGWREIFLWVMTAVLYATWHDPGEHWEGNPAIWDTQRRLEKTNPKAKKYRELKKRLEALPSKPVLRLGYRTIVDRSRPQDSPAPKAFEGITGAPLVKTRVAGHMKRQACGVGLVDRKIVWIEPYWRNADGLERPLSPVHEVR